MLFAGLPAARAGFFSHDFDYTESVKNESGFHLFLHPARSNPADQLAYANQLREKGRLKKAERQYRALHVYWPQSNEAAVAQWMEARLLRRRGKLLDAAEMLTDLLDHRAGIVPQDQVLQELFDLAKAIMNKRKGRLLFGGFAAPERALPMLEAIDKHGPYWEHAPEALFLQGRIQQQILHYEEAIKLYSRVQFQYPKSSWAEEAAFYQGACLFKLSEESPNNEDMAERAWGALSLFVSTYSDSKHLDQAMDYRNRLFKRRARMAFEKARFYDRIVRKPGAALRGYRKFVRLFPNSEWTPAAESRIQELKAETAEQKNNNPSHGTHREIKLRE